MQIRVSSGEFSLISMNKYNICQLEVHDVEVCPLYYQLVPGRSVRSKKSPVALCVALLTNVGFFCEKVWTSSQPRKRWIKLSVSRSQKVHCLLKRCLFYGDNHSLQFFCEEV